MGGGFVREVGWGGDCGGEDFEAEVLQLVVAEGDAFYLGEGDCEVDCVGGR